jgi:glutamine synthetase
MPQGQYYCGVGASNALGREVIEMAYRCFLYAGLKIAGINAEVAPSQWEYQVGITKGIECGDHMWLARYIVKRVGESYGVDCDFEPKPVRGDWNGSGCHTNFSTNKTRCEGGYDYIVKECMPKMARKHAEHITLYGDGNEARLSGTHETSSIHDFSFGSRNRACSVRIPVGTELDGKGYFEDRRPASNIDAYLVSAAIVDTVCLDSKYMNQLTELLKTSKQNKF